MGRVWLFLETYDCDDPVRSEEVAQTHYEFPGEQADGFCTAGEYIVDDVIVLISHSLGFLHVTNDLDSVPDDGRMVLWEIKVLCSKLMHYGIDLNRRRPNSMIYECCWRRTNAQPSEKRK